MPRRTTQFLPGHYYHLYNRGAGRASIVREEENYLYLLRLLKKVAAECQIAIIAYCLLPNHYHWLVRQDGDTSAELLPQRVFNSYTRAFNRRYGRSGTLFEGRFKVKPIESDVYLRHLCRYIHLNPVKHGIAAAPDLWPYSNYRDWIGKREGTLIDRDFVCAHFGSPQRYKAFVEDYSAGLPEEMRWWMESLEE